MKTPPVYYLHKRVLRLFMLLFLSSYTANINLSMKTDSDIASPFNMWGLDGHFEFKDTQHASRDFGNRFQFPPHAILRPESVSDIVMTLKHVYVMGPSSNLTVAARGHGHSLQGQAQAPGGIVVEMESLRDQEMQVHVGESPYIDVSGGELWINVLHESLKHGLAPKSWTDYLYLTVGGTLSNAGVSGQAFRHGPQINNVRNLEIVTGRGEVFNCSSEENADLFYGALGGLGQFGIITRARINLEKAPKMVKWIRVLYSDFSTFTEDQEMLISAEETFDYIEGFVIINRTGLLNNWRSSFDPEDPLQASKFSSDGRTLYCLEMTKNLDPDNPHVTTQEVKALLSRLKYISSTLFQSEVSYVEFLDRVHVSEVKLRAKGLWEVPHPWLNLLVPKSRIHDFARGVFQEILSDSNNGPILIYPVNKSRWDNRTSLVTPDEDIIYLIGFLSSAMPSSTGRDGLEHVLTQNGRILNFCRSNDIAMKQYLPYYTTKEEWRAHFGWQWDTFVRRKHSYDPLAILAPGQRIFQKAIHLL